MSLLSWLLPSPLRRVDPPTQVQVRYYAADIHTMLWWDEDGEIMAIGDGWGFYKLLESEDPRPYQRLGSVTAYLRNGMILGPFTVGMLDGDIKVNDVWFNRNGADFLTMGGGFFVLANDHVSNYRGTE